MDISLQISRLSSALQAAAVRLSDRTGMEVSAEDIQEALVECLGLESETDLLDRQPSADDIERLLFSFDFRRLRPELLEEVVLPDSIIPDGVPRLLVEERIRMAGQVWTIHKNDADPFPSLPHAHSYSTGLTLHLGNGKLYSRRQTVGQVSRKDLLRLRDSIRYRPLPELEL